jgi:hypothetical protein
MVPRFKLFHSIPLHVQKLNCEENVYKLRDHVGEKALNSNLPLELKLVKKNSYCKFSQSLAKKCLGRIHISLCHVALPRRGKTRHHWGNKRTSAKLPHHKGLALIYPMENKMLVVHHIIKQQGCSHTIKDSKSLNERT